MKNLLVIESSPRGEASASRQVAARVVKEIQKKYPDVTLCRRDLAKSPLPHIDAARIEAFFTPADNLSPASLELLEESNGATEELIRSDVVVVSAPMWNFSVPSSLKAWVDHVVRVGLSFKYGAQGPVGLLSPQKKVILVLSAGGSYRSGPAQALEHHGSYLSTVFRFLGITDIQIIHVDGTAIDGQTLATDRAISEISGLSL